MYRTQSAAIAILLALLCARPASAQSAIEINKHRVQPYAVSRLTLYLGTGMDLGTTLRGFSIGRVERNPLINKLPGNRYVATSFAVMGSSLLADRATAYLRSRGHRNLAILANFTIGGLHASAAIHNIRTY